MKINDLLESQELSELSIPKGKEVNLGGKTYRWLGAQWAVVNPATGKASQIAPSSVAAQLNKAAGPTFAQKVGKVAKGVGAVGGGIAGVGRALKKGFSAGQRAVGGAPIKAQSTQIQQPAQTAAGNDEVANLQARLQSIENRLRNAGV